MGVTIALGTMILLRFADELDVERDCEVGCERDMLLRLLAKEVARCTCGCGGGIVMPGCSCWRTGMVTGLRIAGACRVLSAASFFAASASSMRFSRSSRLMRSFSATADPGSSKFAFVSALVDFAWGAMLMLTGRWVDVAD